MKHIDLWLYVITNSLPGWGRKHEDIPWRSSGEGQPSSSLEIKIDSTQRPRKNLGFELLLPSVRSTVPSMQSIHSTSPGWSRSTCVDESVWSPDCLHTLKVSDN
jgi:hypothetical protein